MSYLNVYADGTVDLNGLSQTINALNGYGTVLNSVSATPVTLTIGSANTDFNGQIFSGTLDGNMALTKVSTDVFVLGGAKKTYIGTTTVSGG